MENARPFQEFARYSSLSVLGMIAISCYILADTFFVSRSLGTNGLAALNLAIPAYNFIHGTGLMLGMGGATRFSICKSRGDDHIANIIFTNTLYLTAIFSAVFLAAGLFFSAPLAIMLGADGAVFDMTATYLQVLLLFSPAFILNDVLLCFVRNDGNPQLAMLATVGSSLSNVVLDYVFMFPFRMGIFGAVLATGMSPVIGVVIMAPHWVKKSKGFHIVKTGFHGESVRFHFSLGFPSLLGQLSSGVVMIIFNSIILQLEGNTGVAAYGVIANISLVVTSIYTGIAQGVQPLVSREYGRGHRESQQTFLRFSMITMLVLSAVIYGVIFLFADPIAAIFNSEHNEMLQQIAVTGLKLYFTSVAFVGYNTIIATYFTSVEEAVPAHVVSLLRGLILIVPMAFILSALWGMTGVWLAFPVTELIVMVVGLYFSAKSRKRG
ncbi:MAG TPA: MATE family efflux transporter [Candidatus Lachnoclostridium stercorigallinarum]|uniref:Multidrug export protein MepA n=1 Tax=Candidatus Lachnoclostridium stercorigallinarum TaxID=2838634 RepID=A0A9D2GFP9_9FIRM|nr:MATE family efflux transporter [Candidatus Lachnoclostridium stercorigallinarum]